MGLPTTLSGIVGFILFVIFLLSISVSDIYPDQTKSITDAQSNFLNTMNTTKNSTATNPGFWGTVMGITGLDGIYNFITNFFSMIVSFMIMVIGYTGLFLLIPLTVPAEFLVIFIILVSYVIIAILKLIFLNGE